MRKGEDSLNVQRVLQFAIGEWAKTARDGQKLPAVFHVCEPTSRQLSRDDLLQFGTRSHS